MSAAESFDDPYGGIHAGSLEVRLARSDDEIDAAQALRYRIFYEEMGARPSAEMRARKRDFDCHDEAFDHLLVIDHDRSHPYQSVIGTYRLNRRSEAERKGGFYTASEYDLGPLLETKGEIMELGRSCVSAEYRNRATMALLWRGIAAYVFHFDINLMFGCASMAGVDLDRLALPLSYLHYRHLAPEGLRPRALPELYTAMDRLDPEAVDVRQARLALPPLIKGYLRVGSFVGDGAVVDHQFQTTDVCIVIKIDSVVGKYRQHFGVDTYRPAPVIGG